MSYIKPMVMVFQEYAATSSKAQGAILSPCIIGPCYHIVNAESDEALALVGEYTRLGLEDIVFPNNVPGALIQKESVRVRLKNARALLAENVALEASSAGNAIVFPDGQYPAAKIGDYVFLDNVNDPLFPERVERVFRVLDCNEATRTLLLNFSIPENITLAATIERPVDEIFYGFDSPGVSLDISGETLSLLGLTVEVDGVELQVSRAETYVGYKALRQDLSRLDSIESVDEIRGKLGPIVPENPLAFGVSVCQANTTVAVKFVGVRSDDLAGYTEAKDRIEAADPVYAIVPLTQNAGILSMFKMHCEQMSQPEKGHWRIALGNTPLVTNKVMAEGMAQLKRDGSGDFCVVSVKTDSELMSSGVAAGDLLLITDGRGEVHEHVIASVVSEDRLTVVQSESFDATVFDEISTYSFIVRRELSRLEQAEEVAGASRSFGSSRFVHIWPDICIIDDQELPGYYLACAVAGGIGGLASHYPFTNLSMSGIAAVRNSSDLFSGEQLDVIAGGGTFIFVQDSSAGVPYVRHQLTTDMATNELCELSFVKNFDYVCYCCRDAMAPFIGKWNITAATLAALSTALSATLESLKLDVQPKIGSRVLSHSIKSVSRLETDRTRVEMYANVEFPYPLNTIGLHIVSI